MQFVHSEFPEDNLKLIAMSDASGEYEYVLLERRSGSDMGGLWNETQLTRGGGIKGVMSYSTISPDSSSLVFDDTSGRISVLNLSSTAVNTFDFRTQAAKESDGDYAEGAGSAQMQMLQQMNDPSAIGPAMAVALLTTFYGALLANLVGIPLANKMKQHSQRELAYKELVAQGLVSILGGENPRFMVERLNATLPPSERYEEAA